MVLLKNLAKGAMNLFLPGECAVCKEELEPLNRSFICYTCWQKVEWLSPPFCSKCGKILLPDSDHIPSGVCSLCQETPPHFQRLFVPALYQGVMAQAIRIFKYTGKRGILRGFDWVINHYFKAVDLSWLKIDAVVPVPLHPRRLKERGFNQSEDIARLVARKLEVQMIKDCLVRTRYTLPQTKLKKGEREKNIKDAFLVKRKLKGKKVLLVDDVYTTGVTLNEASLKIKRSGAQVFAFTLARTPE